MGNFKDMVVKLDDLRHDNSSLTFDNMSLRSELNNSSNIINSIQYAVNKGENAEAILQKIKQILTNQRSSDVSQKP